MNFSSYRLDYCRKYQKRLNTDSWFAAFSGLLVQVTIYFILLGFGLIHSDKLKYILIRIVSPSSINLISTLIITILLKKHKSDHKKNFLASLNIFIICSVFSIFHNYFTFILSAMVIPILVCSIFGERIILKKISLLTIPVYIIASIILLKDEILMNLIYRIISVICAGALITGGIILSRIIVKSQRDQINFILTSFKNQEKLIHDMRIEPLTKLSNRIAMNECAANIFQRFHSEKIQPYMVLFDIDFFKSINDTYGHLCGDVVLVCLADIMIKKLKGNRNSFRFGGEEFVILIDDSEKDEIFSFVEEIRTEFSSKTFDFAPDRNFTLSAGIAPLYTDWSIQKWFEATDSAMYRAKKGGRNRTVFF